MASYRELPKWDTRDNSRKALHVTRDDSRQLCTARRNSFNSPRSRRPFQNFWTRSKISLTRCRSWWIRFNSLDTRNTRNKLAVLVRSSRYTRNYSPLACIREWCSSLQERDTSTASVLRVKQRCPRDKREFRSSMTSYNEFGMSLYSEYIASASWHTSWFINM